MVDWSYVASLFDHKGNINLLKVKGKEYIQLRLYSRDEKILKEIKTFLDCGNIYKKELSKKNRKWKDQFELTITTKEDIFLVLTQITPFLKVKQKEIQQLLSTHKLFRDFDDVEKEVKEKSGKDNGENFKKQLKNQLEIEAKELSSEDEEIDELSKVESEMSQNKGDKEDISYIG